SQHRRGHAEPDADARCGPSPRPRIRPGRRRRWTPDDCDPVVRPMAAAVRWACRRDWIRAPSRRRVAHDRRRDAGIVLVSRSRYTGLDSDDDPADDVAEPSRIVLALDLPGDRPARTWRHAGAGGGRRHRARPDG